ncbi:MAG: hypothetical protein J7518_00920 [Nocardioidaceae bacterium]|nr:hypothetical protein [Nocardioidaceae bacterium]
MVTDANGDQTATSGVVGGVKVVVNSDGMLVPAGPAKTSAAAKTTAPAAAGDTLELLPIITGRLLDATGLGAGSVDIELFKQTSGDYVDDGSGKQVPTAIDLDPVGTAVTDSDGFFTGLVALVDPDANYELRAVVGDEQVVYDFAPTVNGLISGLLQLLTPAVAVINSVTGPVSDAVSYLDELGSLVPGFIVNLVNGLVGDGGNLVIPAPDGYVPPAESDDPSSPPPAPAFARTASQATPAEAQVYVPGPCAYPFYLRYQKVSGVKYAMLPTRFTHTALKSTQEVRFHTDKKTKGGVAFDLAGKKVAGGIQYGTETDGSLSFDWTIPYDVFATQFVEWRYTHYKERCFYRGLWTDRRDDKLNYKWVMAVPAIGASAPREYPWGPGFACKHQASVGAAVTTSQATTTTFGGYFAVIGIRLDASQQQTSATSVRIVPKPGTAPRYCISGADIRASSLFEEVR